jgi:hypothetical protein
MKRINKISESSKDPDPYSPSIWETTMKPTTVSESSIGIDANVKEVEGVERNERDIKLI